MILAFAAIAPMSLDGVRLTSDPIEILLPKIFSVCK